jgi:hypothetical protein
MTNRWVAPFATAVLVIALAAATFWWLAGRRSVDSAAPADGAGIVEPAAGQMALFFPGRGDRLYVETRELPATNGEADIEGRVRSVLAELLSGPSSQELFPALPESVEIGDVIATDDGIVYVDLASKEPLLSGLGSKAELLSVYSLVNTTLVNEPRARAVVLLWNGRQPLTLAGHVDVGHPLGVNRALIAESS